MRTHLGRAIVEQLRPHVGRRRLRLGKASAGIKVSKRSKGSRSFIPATFLSPVLIRRTEYGPGFKSPAAYLKILHIGIPRSRDELQYRSGESWFCHQNSLALVPKLPRLGGLSSVLRPFYVQFPRHKRVLVHRRLNTLAQRHPRPMSRPRLHPDQDRIRPRLRRLQRRRVLEAVRRKHPVVMVARQ